MLRVIQEMMNNIPNPVILNTYQCEGCLQEVNVTEMLIAGSPDKGKVDRFYLGCKCEDMKLAKSVLDNDRKAKLNRMREVFDQKSLVNKALQKATFDNYIPPNLDLNDAKKSLIEFVETFKNSEAINILLVGSFGTGKSHLSYATTQYLIAKGHSALFLSVPKLLTKIKDTYNGDSKYSENDLLELVQDIDLLVLDDLGAEYTNARAGADNWVWSKLFEIIDSRSGRHTIYTTNLTAEDLEKKVNTRNFSRIMDNTKVIKMNGKDYRRKDF